ncbi:glutamine--fructose-6-phosphate transaminase (isomerizing) [Clostridium folliculivorans]|uniref:Glutamine--fructose-6-phosphate aminotransferase [isomerizing] n=1 Tax=Clostridium folliculivorans TaxID=2886038 RepID=A0A9W5Y0M4_9CLOT|nr:glutamine--fructose-6-phosphate transaminase (isomerizing) [Clostridium folliculivorans]GKU24549.1 glutamine--fructose-6-phosphate aminotransferase [isomerizing] [Clostridium folliculivorans]GKU30647.1 glutamine--fructose-6-phosphate aminotransferase [isomerizing] [Clostridium folliculivorans]
MCGIVGYLGEKKATPILVEGLSKLEYRGYDSSGIAVIEDGEIKIEKCRGRLSNLKDKVADKEYSGSIGIGHTRWATHGEPSDVNSHPHSNKDGTIAVVHNGIIENYIVLREWLISEGYKFVSETDTEVIPHLVDYYFDGNLEDAVIKATKRMEGSYALGVVAKNDPGKIVAVRKDSPLVIGVGEDGKESFIASDIPAVLNMTRDVYLLEDKEFVVMTKDGITIYDESKNKVEKQIFHVTWDIDAAEKGGYDHFMLKEIYEQPKAIKDTLTSRVVKGEKIKLDGIHLTKEQIENFDRVYIIACGTAYHSGVVGKYVIERLAKIPVEIDVASEFRYRNPLITDRTLMICISQSGETADTLAALRLAKEEGARIIAITNVVGSSISREADDVFYTWAGPEIAVASTKAYITMLIALYIIALYMAEAKNTVRETEIEKIKDGLLNLSEKTAEILNDVDTIKSFVDHLYSKNDVYYLGRGLDYAVAMEGSLKLKEISYIHSEAYAGGELKHGTIALIEEGTSVIALATQSELYDKQISNIREVKTRGANVLGIAMEGQTEIEKTVDQTIYIPKVMSILAPVLSVIPLQILAYYTAVQKGCDVDKPRNLAKSVTVE